MGVLLEIRVLFEDEPFYRSRYQSGVNTLLTSKQSYFPILYSLHIWVLKGDKTWENKIALRSTIYWLCFSNSSNLISLNLETNTMLMNSNHAFSPLVVPNHCWFQGHQYECGLSLSCVFSGSKPMGKSMCFLFCKILKTIYNNKLIHLESSKIQFFFNW